MDLNGEIAIVTGGSRNIGLSVATALRRAGARVCVVARSDQNALDLAVSSLGGDDANSVMGRRLDVSDEAAVIDLFERIETAWDAPTILVNGAASRPHRPFVDLTRSDWTDVIDTILTGAFLTSRELFRRLPDEKNGAIVNLGGLSAHQPATERAHVIAAKSGLEGLTRALAQEGLGRIRANTIVPGVIRTKRRPGQAVPPGDDRDPRRPVGTPDDVARVVLGFSDPADVYVTGQTVHVSGGRFMP